MKNVICNIPHAGLLIPEFILEDFIISKEEIIEFAEKIVDKNIDELFKFVPASNKVISPISRVVVDMERYKDDNKEKMAQIGMGLFYTHDDTGKPIRTQGKTYPICLGFYNSYHERLEQLISNSLRKNNSCYILDCHSFHEGLTYTGYEPSNFPDICLGYNEPIPHKEIYQIADLFKHNGYSVDYNTPFSGSILPEKFLNNKKVKSIMLEINRKAYINSNEDFNKIQKLCKEVVGILSTSY